MKSNRRFSIKNNNSNFFNRLLYSLYSTGKIGDNLFIISVAPLNGSLLVNNSYKSIPRALLKYLMNRNVCSNC